MRLSGDRIQKSLARVLLDTQSTTPPGTGEMYHWTIFEVGQVDWTWDIPVCVFYYHSTNNVDQSSRSFNLKFLSSDGQRPPKSRTGPSLVVSGLGSTELTQWMTKKFRQNIQVPDVFNMCQSLWFAERAVSTRDGTPPHTGGRQAMKGR